MTEEVKLVVAHVNHHFFAATQTFIYHYLSHLQRVHSICLTRSAESKATMPPEALPDSFYLYGNNRSTGLQDVMQKVWDLGVREVVTRSPPALANRLLKWIHRFIVPMVRSQKYVEGYVEWAGEIIRQRNVRLIHAYYGPIAWRLLHLKRKLHLPFIVSFLGDDIMPTLPSWYQCWIGSDSVKSNWTECLFQLMNEADLILVEGPFFRERVIELGCPPERVQIQRIAIPLKKIPFVRDGSGRTEKLSFSLRAALLK